MVFDKRFLLNTLLIFSIIFDVSFVAFPALTSGRIAILFFFAYFASIKRITFKRNFIYLLTVIFFLFVASLIQFISSNDFIQSSRLLWFSIYGIIFPYFLSQYFKSLEEFLYCFLFATSVQSIIAINSFFNPDVKQFISSMVVVGGNDLDEAIYRAISFSGSSGAALSVIQFCGVYSGLVLLRYCHAYRARIMIWIGILCCLLSTLIIGRTGLLCSLLSIVFYLFSTFNLRKIIWLSIFFVFITQINFISILESQTESIPGFKTEFFMNWIEEAFTVKDNNTANAINEMPIPPLKLNTILGTGKIFNNDLMKNASGNDSGYIQTYYSLGIILAFVFYVTYFLFLLLQIQNKEIISILFLIALIFLIEVKEPFIFKYMFPFFVLNFILLSKKEKFIQQN